MKKRSILTSLAALFTLVGCSSTTPNSSNTSSYETSSSNTSSVSSNGTSSSVSSTSSGSNDTSINSTNSNSGDSTSSTKPTSNVVTFSEAIRLLEAAQEKESLNSSSETVIETSTYGDIVDVKSQTYTMYSDYSSSSVGTIVEVEKDVEKNRDTFKSRKVKVVDKIQIPDALDYQTYPMFVSVTDYGGTFAKNAYQDTAAKVYMIDTELEAANAGLSAGSYILTGSYPSYATAMLAYNTEVFIASDLNANAYVSQLGINTFNVKQNSDNTYEYSCKAEFSYDEELVTTYETIEAKFVLSEDKTQLLSTYYSHKNKDVNLEDKEDFYVSATETSGTLTYGERSDSSSATGLINVDDYFLQTINDIEILKIADNSFDRIVADPNDIPLSSHYIFAKAKDYTPVTALSTDIKCSKSSDSKVVCLDSAGYMEVVGTGTTTLTFTYFGKDTDGVYKEMNIEKDVTVTTPAPKSVSLLLGNSGIDDKTIDVGKDYSISTFVNPKEANQAVEAVSSDESVLTVKVDSENNTIIVHGVKEGTATITVTSIADKSLSTTLTLNVIENIDFSQIIVNKTYHYTSSYGYTFDMTFKADGTGDRVQKLDNGKEYTDTFNWKIEGRKITFSNWNESTKYDFIDGNITSSDGSTISVNVVNNATYVFTVVTE